MVDVHIQEAGDPLRSLFSFFDTSRKGYISAAQVQILHEEMRVGGISMPQVLASVEYLRLDKGCIYLSDLPELLQAVPHVVFANVNISDSERIGKAIKSRVTGRDTGEVAVSRIGPATHAGCNPRENKRPKWPEGFATGRSVLML